MSEINLKTDVYSRTVITDSEVADMLYTIPSLNIDNIDILNPEKYNMAIKNQWLDWKPMNKLEEINLSVDEFHTSNQQIWFMPQQYKDMDIAEWILEQCADQNELQRAGIELLEYAKRDLLPLLQYLKYLVDTMKENNIVWGVGRGSSVASFVLYLIGVHRIHSLKYNLDFTEFMR